jgi:ligand-binding sensor domain-containing protein/putative methionine-R-sulfoxide reductase with GAF domain
MRVRLLYIFFFCSIESVLAAQTGLNFQHLNTPNGLSYTGANGLCTDKKGNLWIATGNGLNMFNGRTVEKYFATDHPQLHNSAIVDVVCDEKNRVWVLTYGGGVTMIDEKRQFHRIAIYEGKKWVRTLGILDTDKHGAILYTPNGNYSLKESRPYAEADSLITNYFNFLPIKDRGKYQLSGTGRSFHFNDDFYLVTYQNSFLLVKYMTNTVEKKYAIPNCTALVQWETDELLFYDAATAEIKSINLVTEEIKFPFKNLKDQKGKLVTGIFGYAQKIDDDRYVLTTSDEGIFIYYKNTHKIYNYRHELTDPASINGDNTTHITLGSKGWVFITCYINGVSYFNIHDVIGDQNVFVDKQGNGYDGTISGIATRDNDTYYFGTSMGLLEWKRSTNTSTFIDFKGADGKPIFKNKEIGSIAIDNDDNIWAGVLNDGIVIIGKNKKIIKYLRNEQGNKRSLKIRSVRRVNLGPDGYMWTCGRNGISRIDPKTFEIDNFENTSLGRMDSFPISPLLFDKNYLWIGASDKGLYQYDLKTKQLTEHAGYGKYKGEGIYDLNMDSAGTLYVANGHGLRIFYKDGREKRFTQKDGLLINRAEGLLLDRYNRMWVGNDIGLACYNPADSSLRAFDGRQGLSIYGFRVGSYFKTPNGEFIFGTPKGIQYFHPDSLYNRQTSLNVLINKIETKNIVSNITGNGEFKLAATDNQVTFHFSTVDFSPHIRTYYEYRLIDLDKDWIKTADQNSVRYNSLPWGKYVFKVRISNDNKTWQDAGNEVTVIIAAPFYQRWWFRLLAVAIALLIAWYVYGYFRKKQQKQREELETELVISYFASQINSSYKTDELLWDVAKNLIGKLGFEDCMIYLWNNDRTILIQKAGYGSKGSMQSIMDKEVYHIPKGKGIVGAAVESKHSLLINDTSKDKRYFSADGKIMLSELCVPLVHGNEVLGAINTEHNERNFFTAKHLQMLSTIAVLCANQIQRIHAEEEKQQAKIEVLQNKQKIIESRLQSLRLQMNPHFLFNALNSIQQMILANEEMIATRYLSKFSKLLRTILVHSDKESVSLKEELEILNLYVELESIRFKDSFTYNIEVNDEIDTDEIKLPTLLIQPFVENAIWHGLMHKEGDRLLTVKFSEKDECIECIIEDNGIGRERSGETKLTTGQGNKHTSKGIAVSKERLNAMGNGTGQHGSVQIIDLRDEQGNAKGTRVQIIFPTQNN